MQKTPEMPGDFSPEQAKRLAQTPAGGELIALLRQNAGTELQAALEKASAGDYSQAKAIIARSLSSPQVQELLKKLGG